MRRERQLESNKRKGSPETGSEDWRAPISASCCTADSPVTFAGAESTFSPSDRSCSSTLAPPRNPAPRGAGLPPSWRPAPERAARACWAAATCWAMPMAGALESEAAIRELAGSLVTLPVSGSTSNPDGVPAPRAPRARRSNLAFSISRAFFRMCALASSSLVCMIILWSRSS